MMYANNFPKMPAKHLSPLNLGFQISPDITIEFVKPKIEEVDSEKTISGAMDDDDDYDSYFNPLIYCTITMDDAEEESTFQEDSKPSTPIWDKSESTSSKTKKVTKNILSNENSSSVCNGADSSFGGKVKKRFSCHLCQKTFGWTTDLKRHILIHTGERPFKCTMCFATFTRNFLLQKHKTKIHQCLSPNEISQLNNNVARNLMEIKQKMLELENAKSDDDKYGDEKPKSKKLKKKNDE